MSKQAKCRHCRKKIHDSESIKVPAGQFCSHRCINEYVKIYYQERSHRKTKKAKKAIKTQRELLKAAQSAVNRYVRLRDQGQRCISCGKDLTGIACDAGHYRSVGSAAHLRFYTLNINAQCKKCNHWLSGNVVEYRHGMIGIYGQNKVDEIESMYYTRKWDKKYLIRLTKIFRAKYRLYKQLFREQEKS